MRPDMAKVIVERPRALGGTRHPKGEGKEKQVPWEDQPKREKIQLKWVKNYRIAKEFTDCIGPLRRWAISQIGRDWDLVYSEIREVLRPRSKMDQHAIGHLWDFIARDVILGADGRPYDKSASRYLSIRDGNGYLPARAPVYVHPLTGKLCKNPYSPEFRRVNFKRPNPARTKFVGGKHYVKRKEIWYEVLTSPLPPDTVAWVSPVVRNNQFGKFTMPGFLHVTRGHCYDWVVGEDLIATPRARVKSWYHGQEVYATGKRQLNKREIRRLKNASGRRPGKSNESAQ